jgi:uroporphyrinogen decarboxylase
MTSGQMTKVERLRATLAGQETDRSPISFWHHFPGQDRTVSDLVGATLEFQERFDLDLIKLMPTGMFSIADYGAIITPRDDDMGTTQVAQTPIASPNDWARLPVARADQGELAAQVEVVRRIRAALGADVPLIQTVFSPLTMAHKLAGDVFFDHLRTAEELVQQGLERFAEDCVSYGRACLDAGADGFFFATQDASHKANLPDGSFERLGPPYDLRVLNALAQDERNWCTVLHLHGVEPFFDLAQRYPVHAVNWHDRETPPSIQEASGRTTRAMVAGINRKGAIVNGDTSAAVAEVRDAIRQAGGRRLIVAPGCVLPKFACDEPLFAVRRAVDQTSASIQGRE